MNYNELAYLGLLRDVLENGQKVEDRTGVGTLSVFGRQLKFDLSDNQIPLMTTKRTYWKAIVIELLWLLRGETNIKFLKDYGITIWDEWADDQGNLGPVYGQQWRAWRDIQIRSEWDQKGCVDLVHQGYRCKGKIEDSDQIVYEAQIDQVKDLIGRIKTNRNCRRMIVSAWNPADVPRMKLPPCHSFFQFKVYGDELECHLYMRSADLFLGVPFNIASYALLTHLVAHTCGLRAKALTHSFGDAHIYLNHLDAVREQMSREPYDCPKVRIQTGGILEFVDGCHLLPWGDKDPTVDSISSKISLEGYRSHPAIRADVAV